VKGKKPLSESHSLPPFAFFSAPHCPLSFIAIAIVIAIAIAEQQQNLQLVWQK